MGVSAGVGDVIVDAAAIDRRVRELAREIDAHYAGIADELQVVCVLTGSLIFTADLVRAMSTPLRIECVSLRSYGDGTSSSGHVELAGDVSDAVDGRDVLIVEDIVDTGHTAAFLSAHLTKGGARSVRLATLLDKPSRRQRAVQVDWRGFEIPDVFVVGYGLDHRGRHRGLRDVHAFDAG